MQGRLQPGSRHRPVCCVQMRSLQCSGTKPTPVTLQPVMTRTVVGSVFACCTGRAEFSDLALRVLDGLAAETEPLAGLAPIMVDPETGRFASKTVSLGARGDSYYEYLLKQWLLSGRTNDGLLRCVRSPAS